MFKRFMLLCIVIIGTSLSGKAQTMEVKINPLNAIFGKYSVSGEYLLAENMGIEVGLDFINQKIKRIDLKRKGFGASATFNYYFGPEDKCDNFYAFPYINFKSRSWDLGIENSEGKESSVTLVNMGLGIGGGYKWVSANNIIFDIGLGVGKDLFSKYSFKNVDESFDEESAYITLGISFFGKLAVGYRF